MLNMGVAWWEADGNWYSWKTSFCGKSFGQFPPVNSSEPVTVKARNSYVNCMLFSAESQYRWLEAMQPQCCSRVAQTVT